jgi:hypothetical protein
MADKPVVYYGRPLTSRDATTNITDFSKHLTIDHESEVPLLALTSLLPGGAKPKVNTYKFAVGRFAPRTSVSTGVAASAAGVDVNLPVANLEYFAEGDTVEVPSDHDVIDLVVDANNRTSQLYVKSLSAASGAGNLVVRAFNPAFGTALVDNADLVRRIGPAMVEASSGRNPSQTVPTVYTQNCQVFENYVKLSKVQAQNVTYTDPERSRLREEVRKKTAVDIETAMFLQKFVTDTTTVANNPRLQMSGLFEQIKSNSLTYGAALADTELYALMVTVHAPAFSAGTKRMVLASLDLMSEVSKLGSNAIRITVRESTWGPSITEVQFAGKIWEFIEAPVLTDARPGQGLVVHPSYMAKRDFQPMIYEMNVQNPVDKFYMDGFWYIGSIENRMEEVGALIKG